jgi:hypothetical protein
MASTNGINCSPTVPTVPTGARGRALAQKPQSPAPLAGIGAQTKEEWGIFPAQPLEYLQRRTWIGPGLGVAHRNLAAVRKTGFGSRSGLAVDHGDIMPLLAQKVGGGDTKQACSEHDDFHVQSFWEEVRNKHRREEQYIKSNALF